MQVDLTPEQEAALVQLAGNTGKDPVALVQEAVTDLLSESTRFHAAVRAGIAQADRGEFIEEDEMDIRLEEMLRA